MLTLYKKKNAHYHHQSSKTQETVTIQLKDLFVFHLGPPDLPKILNNKSELNGKNITVTWTRPPSGNCEITMYSIRYRVIEPTQEEWTEINITDLSILSHDLHLQYSKKYAVVVLAWNSLGQSMKGKAWEVRTAQGKEVKRLDNITLRFNFDLQLVLSKNCSIRLKP